MESSLTHPEDGQGGTPAAQDLIVCPHCDAAYRAKAPEKGSRATCRRCHAVLIAPRDRAGSQIIALALTTAILIISASFFPFLSIAAAGKSNAVSVVETALAFEGGLYSVLAWATLAMVVGIPLVRALIVLYVLVPVVRDKPPARYAVPAFRIAEELRPWAMADIFALGCAVALIKVADLAELGFGPAFWMFGALVVLIVYQESFMCKWTVWQSLDTKKR